MEKTTQLCSGDLTHDIALGFAGCRHVACDIETNGLSWRVNQMAQIQLCGDDGTECLLRFIPNRTPVLLYKLLADETVRKVFHHVLFDLPFLYARARLAPAVYQGFRPANMACTKALARILKKPSASLKNLLLSELGVDLPKDQAVSNWFAPHLTAAQLEYAMNDVRYLLPLYDRLMEQAQAQGLADLAHEVFAFIPTQLQVEQHGITKLFLH